MLVVVVKAARSPIAPQAAAVVAALIRLAETVRLVLLVLPVGAVARLVV
jgi:hypothetical protein